MAKKPIINPVSPGNNSAAINANLQRIAEAFENTVSRDGSTPNHMLADFDMNSNDILNAKSVQAEQVLINGVDIEDYVVRAEDAADYAEEQAERAEGYADEVKRSATQEQTTFLTVEGQTLYTHDSEGKELNLAPSGCDLFGPGRDILVRGVDYDITPEGHILLAYEPDGYDLYVVNFLQRYTNDNGTNWNTLISGLSNGRLGFYGATPVARQSVAPAATDEATAITLVNDLRTILINLGLAQ